MTNSFDKGELTSKAKIILDMDAYIPNSEIVISSEGILKYKACDLMVALLSSISLDPESEEFLIQFLLSKDHDYPRLLISVFTKYGKINKILSSFNIGRYPSYDPFLLFMKMFIGHFDYFLAFMNDHDFSLLLGSLENGYQSFNGVGHFNTYYDILKRKIILHRYDVLEKNLGGINIEINKDKEEVKYIINYLGFAGSDKYNEFLTNLDKHFYSTTKDSIEIAGLISSFRQFTSDIVTDIAVMVAMINGLSDIPNPGISGVTSKIGHARYYLKNEFELSDHEDKLLNNFIQILHEEGGHAFISSMEYFRLTKNIFIEIVLLLLYKLKELKEVKETT